MLIFHEPGCYEKFRNVPCSWFYRRQNIRCSRSSEWVQPVATHRIMACCHVLYKAVSRLLMERASIKAFLTVTFDAPPANEKFIIPHNTSIWLAKWCKIHKSNIHLNLIVSLWFTDLFIHIQQLRSYQSYTQIHIQRYISQLRIYLFTFPTHYNHSLSRSKFLFNTVAIRHSTFFCASSFTHHWIPGSSPLHLLETSDYIFSDKSEQQGG